MSYYYYYPYVPRYYRQNEYPYPPVNIALFETSLSKYQQLIQHGNRLVTSLASSQDLMYQIMYSAQEGDRDTVDRIIREIGVPTEVNTTFTPTGVTFTLFEDAEGLPRCCTLTMNLRWG
ncbi:hypothetical protein [Alkalihalobacterium bogoriense]|uniref:hypothetical protein n=1 Tax=Alkalihalobacterium bogoriense TaxID=246272 RepID=UPI0004797F49|nr:hypothetical protein [Alkalihalobacterium bogoriense]